MTSLQRIRINSRTRDLEERRTAERKRAMLVLVLDYLEKNGYLRAMQTLQSEGGLTRKAFDVTDNIDLEVVVRGFEDYFQMKFGKRPRLFREREGGSSSSSGGSSAGSRGSSHKHRGGGGGAGGGGGPSVAKKALSRAAAASASSSSSSSTASRGSRGQRRQRHGGSKRTRGQQQSKTGSNGSSAGGVSATTTTTTTTTSAAGRGDRKSAVSTAASSSSSGPPSNPASSSVASADSEPDLNFMSVGRVPTKGRKKGGGARRKLRPVGTGSSSQKRHHPRYGGGGASRTAAREDLAAEEEEEEEGEERCGKNRKRLVAEGGGGGGEGSVPSHDEEIEDYFSLRLMKPLTTAFSGEYREYAEGIRRDIIVQNPMLYWSDIVGLEKAKQLTTEAVVLPIKYPAFFTGVLRPWTGILLFGPPGTGKTMLAKAVATECKTTFFNISASTIVSKWRGDSEKLVRVLFEMARFYAPSTIFIDEIDAILSQRRGSEHEASRRMKTELMIQMDGVRSSQSDPDARVFILAASNLPWDLDNAVLRRLEKRILVGLPSTEARKTIFEKSLGDRCDENLDFAVLSQKTEGFSGADIVCVCKEGLMRPVRRILSRLESVNDLRSSQDFLDQEIDPEKVRVSMDDLLQAIEVTKPSGNQYQEKYEAWNREHGAHL